MSSAGSGGADALQLARDWLSARVGDAASEPMSGCALVPGTTELVGRDRAESDGGGSGSTAPGNDHVDQTAAAQVRRSSRNRKPDPEVEDEHGREDDADPEAVARAIVLRKLAAQDHTRSELAHVLSKRRVPTGVAEQVLTRFEEAGLVDDTAFAKRWVESRQQRRHLSRTALRRELMAKGVGAEEIDSALAPVAAEEEFTAALTLAQKKVAALSGLDRDVRYRRVTAALARRGFGPAVISPVLAEVLGGGADPTI